MVFYNIVQDVVGYNIMIRPKSLYCSSTNVFIEKNYRENIPLITIYK